MVIPPYIPLVKSLLIRVILIIRFAILIFWLQRAKVVPTTFSGPSMHNRHLADHSVYAVSFILIKLFNFRKLIITCRGIVGGTLMNQFTNRPKCLLIEFISF